MSRCLVVSPFEAELQPLAAASAAGALRDAHLDVQAWDADRFPDASGFVEADLVMLSVQQFESLERAIGLVPALRAAHPGGVIVAFGQYAQMNSSVFQSLVDAVLFDEPERVATELATAAERHCVDDLPGALTSRRMNPKAPRGRLQLSAPARDLFPALIHYEAHHGPWGLMGNLEASRGCHHKCTYCSVYGAYDGGSAAYETDAVVADALQLADDGVRHFCFIDAEFFNSRTNGKTIMRRVVDEVGPCTFEFTTRVDHVLKYTRELDELVGLGLRRVTSALEFPSDRILRIFDKGIDVADMRRAIVEADRLGVVLNPTFIPFTPWIEYDELLTFEDFLVETGLAKVAEPTVLQTRLLLFRGSPLLHSPWIQDTPLTDNGFWFGWEHEDPRVEDLWHERRVEAEGAGKIRCCVKC